ncbi:hypothetical protein [Halomonas sp. HL-93]|uniref:hypothetical protein n=1 Tax=Halomonas sp. HL-93 TaxID=1666906 RepID=UPI0006D969CB|nr:hypothetical protein [Halomonas sp. HL-93]KPQ24518.1 MAG: Spo7-like protein [Halomonas sp. HL-93]SBR48385.1 hypothetical protein GA0071314_1670 [Halomonas sp. HL-93]
MNNKLVPVIIARPNQKGWGYRSRDSLFALAAFALWTLVMAKLFLFFIIDDAALEHLYESIMIKVVLVGFIVTFLTFHCWALYNKRLYSSYLRRQLHTPQQITPEVPNKVDHQVESEPIMQTQANAKTTSQMTN